MDLVQLTKKVSNDLEVYKNPDISEWVERINPILKALGYTHGILPGDEINSVHITDATVFIQNVCYQHGYADYTSITFPAILLTTDNLEKEVLRYQLKNKLDNNEQRILDINIKIEHEIQTMARLREEIDELKRALWELDQ